MKMDKKILFGLWGAGVVTIAGVALLSRAGDGGWSSTAPVAAAVTAQGLPREAPRAAEQCSKYTPLAATLEAEVQQLRAEVRERDAIIAQQVSALAPSGAQDSAQQSEPHEQAADLLDRRLFAEVDERAAAAHTRAAESLAERALGRDVPREILCGPKMCRIALGSQGHEAKTAAQSLLSKVDKAFAAGTLVQTGDGQTALYFADSPELLSVDESPEPGHSG